MAYGKIITRGFFSENSDYSMPSIDTKTDEHTLTPTLYLHQRLHLSTTEQTLDLSGFTAITALLIVNHSSTAAEIAHATWYTQHTTASDTVTFAQAATGDTITDDSTTSTWTTGTGLRAGSYVRLTSCASATNGSTTTTPNSTCWLVRSATATVITLVAESTVVESASDALSISFEDKNMQGIAAGGQLLVTSNVVPVGDLTLIADSGTPEVEVLVMGS